MLLHVTWLLITVWLLAVPLRPTMRPRKSLREATWYLICSQPNIAQHREPEVKEEPLAA